MVLYTYRILYEKYLSEAQVVFFHLPRYKFLG